MFRTPILIISILAAAPASAYYVSISGQAGSIQDPEGIRYSTRIDDGATSVSFDTGVYTTSGSTAQSASSANLATGTLKGFMEVDGRQVANFSTEFSDVLFFNLPDTITEAEVTVSLLLEGSLEDNYTRGKASKAQLRFGSGIDDLFLSSATLPHTLSVTQTVEEGLGYLINPFITGGTNLANISGYGLIDLGNTAYLSIDLQEGVSFTSESGVLLTSPVPLPAGAWLFISAVGCLVVAKRKQLKAKGLTDT